MRCDYCDNVIEDGKPFYITDAGEVYCSDCIEESSVTYYILDGEIVGSDDDTGNYYNKESAIKDIKWRIDFLNKSIVELEKKDIKYPDCKSYLDGIIEKKKNNIKEEEELLKRLLDKE